MGNVLNRSPGLDSETFKARWGDHIRSLRADLGSAELTRAIKLGAVRELELMMGLEEGRRMSREDTVLAMRFDGCRRKHSARHACVSLLAEGLHALCDDEVSRLPHS